MDRRALSLLLIIALQTLTWAVVPADRAQITPLTLSLGYGPSNLTPVDQGTPVFSRGDHLWVMVNYTDYVEVYARFSGDSPAQFFNFLQVIEPGTPTLLHTFNDSDPTGFWTFTTSVPYFPEVTFLLSNASVSHVGLSLTAHRIQKGQLAMNFSSSGAYGFYDADACVAGAASVTVAKVGIPTADGGGYLEVQANGGQFLATEVSTANGTFSFWFELYHEYSYLSQAPGTTLISRSVRAAESDALTLAGEGQSGALTLNAEVSLRAGRYELRAFFNGLGGLSVEQTPLLMTASGAWLWLGDCEGTPLSTNDFTLTIPIKANPAEWPLSVFLLYKLVGVEEYARVEVPLNVSTVKFIGAPWGVGLDSYMLSATALSGVSEVNVYNGTIYAVIDGGPGIVGYSLSLGNETLFSGQAGSIAPFTAGLIALDVSRLSVALLDNGVPASKGTVRVSDARGLLQRAVLSSQGRAVFYLPEGSYFVEGSEMNNSVSQEVTLGHGKAVSVTLELAGPPSGQGFLVVVLSVTATAGVGLNLLVWLVFRRKRDGRAASTPRRNKRAPS